MKSDITSKTIDGITDLVVWAPIKEGFIDAFANVTYEARLRLVAEALHNVRRSAREHELTSPFPDTAARILSLLDFRVGIVDKDLYSFEDLDGHPKTSNASNSNEQMGPKPKRYMYLVATFDGPWEPYMRLIWDPLGSFLDLLLCNCEGYISAVDNSFEKYAQWVRDNQLDSGIFYSTSGLTVKDKNYLTKLEKYQRELSATDAHAKIARMTSDDPEELALDVRSQPENAKDVNRLALEALTVLYKLADYYRPDRISCTAGEKSEGTYLIRVAREILGSWSGKGLPAEIRYAYREPLNWYEYPGEIFSASTEPDPECDKNQVQKGLLSSYDPKNKEPITHGSLLLFQVTDRKKAKKFLQDFPYSWEGSDDALVGSQLSKIFRNIAFTFEGMENLGLSSTELMKFPKEFREGMEARAPIIGDAYGFHPRRWDLPKRYDLNDDVSPKPPVELHEVDFALQFRTSEIFNREANFNNFISFGKNSINLYESLTPLFIQVESSILEMQGIASDSKPTSEDDNPYLELAPLFEGLIVAIEDFNKGMTDKGEPDGIIEYNLIDILIFILAQLEDYCGYRLLVVEDMFRPNAAGPEDDKFASNPLAKPTRDHFGFRDGLSQPEISEIPISEPLQGQTAARRGDILLGYANSRDDYASSITQSDLLKNGSFLAVRKMGQDVQAFEDFLDKNHRAVGSDKEELAARLVGRKRDGAPLIASHDNEFDYTEDKEGELCPFSSHIRRTNPRSSLHGRKMPLILRRGMSYGERFCEAPEEKRGVVFMAYCASLAEQFEVIQRWVNGGNSTDTYSGHADPLAGPSPKSGKRIYRFVMDGDVKHVAIKKPFVTLRYGAYFFVPSKRSLELITGDGESKNNDAIIKKGNEIIKSIEALPQESQQNEWKRILEDYLTKDPTENDVSPKIWAAIRNRGGIYRIEKGVPFGLGRSEALEPSPQPVVLVADEGLIDKVFEDKTAEYFSVCEQGRRMGDKEGRRYDHNGNQLENGFGRIYVARDPGVAYDDEAYPTNTYLINYNEKVAFDEGYLAGQAALYYPKLIAQGITPLGANPELKLELGRQYIAQALGTLCMTWFGIPDIATTEKPSLFTHGAWNWDDGNRPPQCPGDFMSPSRYGFYPRPTEAIKTYGLRHGRMLRQAVKEMVIQKRVSGTIGTQMKNGIQSNDILERNLIGIMIGALPPMDANLRFAFFEWLKEDTLWRHQGAYHRAKENAGSDFSAAYHTLRKPLMEAMSKRPAPDLIYRTAVKDCQLGSENIKANDLIVLSLTAATQARLELGKPPNVDVVFGGDRLKGDAPHACPAMKMAMGGMMGILAVFLDAGRIQSLPSSMIVRLTDWETLTAPSGLEGC